MEREEIIKKLCEFMKEKFPIGEEFLSEDKFDMPLTGLEINFNERVLTYLFFEVEKLFDIKINTELLDDYKFNTINGVVDIVEQTVNEKLVHA